MKMKGRLPSFSAAVGRAPPAQLSFRFFVLLYRRLSPDTPMRTRVRS